MPRQETIKNFLHNPKEAKYFLASIVESSGDSIVTVNFEGVITSWNRAAEKLYGYPAEEAVGKPLTMLTLPEDLREVLGNIEKIKHSQKVEIYDAVRVHKDGHQMNLDIVISPVEDDEERVVGVSIIARDVTEQRQAENVLRESEEKYRHIFNSIDEGFCLVEMIFDATNKPIDFIFLEINPVFERMTGIENSLGKMAYQLVPNLESFWAETYGRVALTGGSERFENYSAPLNRWFDVHASRVGDETSRRVVIVFTDITTRKRRETNLAFLAETSADFAPLLRAEEIMERVGTRLADHLDLSRCNFSMVDEEADRIECLYAWRRAHSMKDLFGAHHISTFLSVAGRRHYASGKIAVINDARNDSLLNPAKLGMFDELGLRSIIDAPYLKGGRWKFLLTAARAEAGEWRTDEIELVRELAGRIYTRIERARAEEALQASEERLRTLIQNLPGGAMFVLDKNLRYLVAEGEALAKAGLAPADLIGKTIFEALPEELAADYAPRYRRALAGENFEHEHEGHDHAYLSRGVPLRSSGGEIYAVLAISYDITERKRAEAALGESERRFRSVFSSNMTAMGIWTDDGEIPDANDALLELIGYTRAELDDGQIKWNEITPPEFSHLDEKSLREIIERGICQPFEKEYVHKDGRRVPVLIGGGGFDETGKSGVFFAIDLTERKLAEEALREFEERYSLATQAVRAVIYDWNITEDKIIRSRELENLLGFSPDDTETNTNAWWTSRVHPEDAERAIGFVREKINSNATRFEDEYRVQHLEGHYVWVSDLGVFLRDAQGKAVRCVGSVTNVTKRKEAEETLRQSEERLRLLIESAEDYAIFTMTPVGIIDSWNAGAEKTFGWTETEAIGQSGEIIFTPEDRKKGAPKKEIKTALRDGRAPDERFHLRKDGSRFYVSGVMTLLKDASGKARGFVKIARDMTKRIEAEKAKHDKETLQKLVQAQEDERKRIARDLHDELGQQLTALRFKLESIKASCKIEALGEKIEDVQQIAKSIDDGVDFIAWELRPASLDDLGLAAALKKYVEQWSYHSGIPARLNSSVKKVRLAPDVETNLYRIVQEALNNAHKHANAENVEVLLDKHGDSTFALIIEDDGQGFDPQAKMVHRDGMGLIGMKERALLIGGTFEIESAPGAGTTVFVRFPISSEKKGETL